MKIAIDEKNLATLSSGNSNRPSHPDCFCTAFPIGECAPITPRPVPSHSACPRLIALRAKILLT